MTIVRIIFALAAAWGLLAVVPGLFGDAGPRPEYYYGFLGLALVFQLVFVMIALDPVRFAPLIPIAVLEKLAFFLPVSLLYAQGRVAMGPVFVGGMVDGLLMLLFLLAFFLARRAARAA
ncbi:hypothetical protein [Parasphingorhabdus sp.]|uniref:hypothetical protein n=1 Tax=Parasphingorhabdus sp. TaxID=2709688 RepID=UPI00300190B7